MLTGWNLVVRITSMNELFQFLWDPPATTGSKPKTTTLPHEQPCAAWFSS